MSDIVKPSILRDAIRAEMRRQGLSVRDLVRWKIRSRNCLYLWFRGETAMGDDAISLIMERLGMGVAAPEKMKADAAWANGKDRKRRGRK